ncbi:prenyltransferase [Periweissella cryptocerci]|nr:prenyltransferase [Periweissella cryptocerci]
MKKPTIKVGKSMYTKWLTWKNFAAVAEISHAPLNIFWFIFGLAFAQFNFHQISIRNTIVGLILMLIFDGATNVFNNVMDYQKARDTEGYQKHTSTIGKLHLPVKGVMRLAIMMYLITFVLGIVLMDISHWPVIFFGLIGYFVAIQYSIGLRLNGTPFGEIATGMSIGFVIPATVVYINTHINGQILVNFSQPHVLLSILLATVPLWSVMLIGSFGNNTADLREDIANGRKTLVFYLGKPVAVRLIQFLLIVGPLTTIPLVLEDKAPWLTLITILLLPVIWKLSAPFWREQIKQTTFKGLFKAISLPLMVYPVTYFIGMLISHK